VIRRQVIFSWRFRRGHSEKSGRRYRRRLFATGLMEGAPAEVVKELTKDAAFPKRPGYPREFAWLAASIVQNPMLNGQTIRLDGGQRFAPR
jgi:signal recognition particle subunit SEC65